MGHFWQLSIILGLSSGLIQEALGQVNYSSASWSGKQVSLFDDRPSDCPPCPPCFNCNLDGFECLQFAECRKASGNCVCPDGFGGEDCSEPLCGSPAKGKDRQPREGAECKCDDGWTGINCNVCETNEACDALMPTRKEGVCYKDGVVQKKNFNMCEVTNKKIVELLGPRKPQVTFSCDAKAETCNFQFWVEQKESFYCDLDTCTSKMEAKSDRNITSYACEHIKCKCIPERMLCGEGGSVDIGDLLEQEIEGPAMFRTVSTEDGGPESGSIFSEPHLNDLVSTMFGDKTILLQCDAGECLHNSQIPGYTKPVKQINTPLIAGGIAGASLLIVAIIMLFWYFSRRSANRRYGAIHLSDSDDDEDSRLMADHKPAALHFKNVSYSLNGRHILAGVQGEVRPGELLAIMGASGAGKTTFLDILARKRKRGVCNGEFFINGEKIADEDFRSVIGFVDQDDATLPTLTVHETILDSALLRLPKDMSFAAKAKRVEDVERQLGIYHIRDQIVGSEEGTGGRGISGGEKRRLAIACELVTSPSILFLDEPTSGLDSFNAFNVVECLVELVKTYNRTVVFTIHQPRSNIVALFDQLILLANGRAVYSGPFSSCQAYFDGIGYACPPGFNIADYLVDLTMHAGVVKSSVDDLVETERWTQTRSSSAMAVKSIPSLSNVSTKQSTSQSGSPSIDSQQRPRDKRRTSVRKQQEQQLFTRKQDAGGETPNTQSDDEGPAPGGSRNTTQPWLKLSKQPNTALDDPHGLPPDASPTGTDLDHLVACYVGSDIASSVRSDISEVVATAARNRASQPNGEGYGNSHSLGNRARGYQRIGLLRQFRILSVRTWRNLHRNPQLMMTHYAISIILAVFLGMLFYGLTNDIPGFQNRLGFLFFVLALFGFSTLTGLTAFAGERLLFVRERAKGYYHPVAFYAAKVLFDIIPLRLIPPIIFAIIVYPMTGLIATWHHFFTFILFLVLFNFAAASICLFIGIVFRNQGVANLIGSLVMLFSLLFAGFLLNHNTIPKVILWLQYLSIFHFGFEGLIVNEVKDLTLTQTEYGLDISVPGAVIISNGGFNTQAMWPDAIGLAVITAALTVIAYGAMHFLLVEKR